VPETLLGPYSRSITGKGLDLVIDDVRAKLVREACRRVVRGHSLAAISRDWNVPKQVPVIALRVLVAGDEMPEQVAAGRLGGGADRGGLEAGADE
jgi:hypothetical protein